MNCLQCGLEMKMEISSNISETKNTRSCNYYCYSCDIGFHVIMFNIYHVENNLILIRGGGLKIARNI